MPIDRGGLMGDPIGSTIIKDVNDQKPNIITIGTVKASAIFRFFVFKNNIEENDEFLKVFNDIFYSQVF